MTCQSRWISLALGVYVRTQRPSACGTSLGPDAGHRAGQLYGSRARLPTAGSRRARYGASENSGAGGRAQHGARVGVADLPQAQAVGRRQRRPRRAVAGSQDRRASRPARLRPWPTSTSVPTIARTIWWQNALASISNRSSRRRPRSSQRRGDTRRCATRRRRLGLRPRQNDEKSCSPMNGSQAEPHAPRGRAASARATSWRRGTDRARRGSAPCSGSGASGREAGVEVVGAPARRRAPRSPARTAC